MAGADPPAWWRRRPRLLTGQLGRMALYGSSRSVVEGLLGLRGVLLASILGPEQFGVWALFRLILNYGAVASSGLLRGLELEVAQQGENHAAVRAAWGRAAFGCMLAVFGLVTLVTLTIASFSSEPWLRRLLWAVAVGLPLEGIGFYGLSYLRASGSMRGFAGLELLQAALQVVLTLGLGWLYGLSGAFVGFALGNLIVLVCLAQRAPLRPTYDAERLRVMLGVGVPVAMSLLLSTMALTVDRLIVGAVLGIEALGQYAFAVSVASLGLTAALVVRTVVFPDLYGRLGQAGAAAAAINGLVEATIRPFVLVLALLVGGAVVVLGPLATLLLPQYAAAVPPAGLFVFAGIAQGVVGLATLGVVAGRRQKLLPLVACGTLVLNAALAFGPLHFGFGLIGMAAGAVVGRLIYAFAIMMIVADLSDAAPIRSALSILWPIAWCALVSAIVAPWASPTEASTLVLVLGMYLLLALPVLAVLIHHMAAIRRGNPASRLVP